MEFWLGNNCKPGDVVPVKPTAGGYPLPEGLNVGDRVKLIAFDAGYWTVEREGKEFNIFMACIDLPCVYRP